MNLGRDIRFALRTLRGAPLVSGLAVACIGLGIGAVTTVYSTANAFTFRPLPQLADAGDLVLIAESPASDRESGITTTPGTFADLGSLRELSAVGAFTSAPANVAGFDVSERVAAAKVSAGFFRVTGRTAALGRTFTLDDIAETRHVVVLSHGLWRRRFGGDSRVVGSTVRIDGEGYQVIGVMPEDFSFPPGTHVWMPLSLSPAAAADRATRSLIVFGRRAPGVSVEQVGAALTTLGQRIAADHPDTHKGWIIRTQSAESVFGAGPRPFMFVLLAAVGFLLIIACANVANLLLVRATGRRREMGLRVALGASRLRLGAQLLVESLLLAIAGGTLGIVLAKWGIRATSLSVPLEVQQYLPGFGAIVLDRQALVVASLVSMLAGIVFGLVPAIAGTAVDVNSALKDAGRAESRGSKLRALRNGLVVGEIALALMLAAGAALMAMTFRRVSLGNPGFRVSGLLTATITLPEADYRDTTAITRFWGQLRESLASQPGVSAAEVTTVLPMTWNDERTHVFPEGEAPDRPENSPAAGFRRVSPGYLAALGVSQLDGRPITGFDREGAPRVALLSETAARRLLRGHDAVGRRLVIRDHVVTVVGVVHDVRANPLTSDSPTSVMYVPLAQWPSHTAAVVLRATSGDPTALTPVLQRAIAARDPRLAAGEIATMRRVVEMVTSPQSATAQMLLASAFIALVMAAVGTYGVMAYVVSRRAHEIAVRVALGATAGTVLRLVMGGALRLAAWGVAFGVMGAVALGNSMRAILVDTNPSDPVIIGAAAVLLSASALLAGWLPARRATRMDPVAALRAD